jgi:hypothetical protein
MALEEKPDVKLDEAALGPPSVQLQSDSDILREGSMSVEERRLLRKLDRRILPITCLLYLFACQLLCPVWFASDFLTHRRDVRPGQKQFG